MSNEKFEFTNEKSEELYVSTEPKIRVNRHIIIGDVKVPVTTEVDLSGIDQKFHALIFNVVESQFNKDLNIHDNT